MTRPAASPLQPLRSVLYMPASNARALQKAQALSADAVIFDLEDAVAPDAKRAARDQAVAALHNRRAYGPKLLTVRCNGLDTPWGEADLTAAGTAGPDAVVVPKVSGTTHLDQIAALLPAGTRIWAMVETPVALLEIRGIAAHPSVSALVLGTNDLAKELHAPLLPGRAALIPHLALAVLAARAVGIAVLDGVWNDVSDQAGFAAEARQGWELGFDGKTLIHPTQVEPANTMWAPTDQDVARARRIVAAFQEASAAGQGVVVVDGKMVESLHRDEALRTLDLARAIAATG